MPHITQTESAFERCAREMEAHGRKWAAIHAKQNADAESRMREDGLGCNGTGGMSDARDHGTYIVDSRGQAW